MVGRMALNHEIGVRLPVPEHIKEASQLLGLRQGGEGRSHIRRAIGEEDGEGRAAKNFSEEKFICGRLPVPEQKKGL